jgi:hypothetical protein
MATQPCRCGHLGDPRHACTYLSLLIERYCSRISGPLLDLPYGESGTNLPPDRRLDVARSPRMSQF